MICANTAKTKKKRIYSMVAFKTFFNDSVERQMAKLLCVVLE